MTIGAVVLLLVVSGLVLSLDKALHSRHRNRRMAMISTQILPFAGDKVVSIRAASRPATKSLKSLLRWIDAAEFEQLRSSDSEILVFRVVDTEQSAEEATTERGELAVTLDCVRDLLHWIPQQARMVFYRTEGWSPQLVERLLDVTDGRNILLLRGSATLSFAGLNSVTLRASVDSSASEEAQCS